MEMPFDQFVFSFLVDKLFLEQIHNLQFVQFIAVRIRRSLDDIAEFRLHGLGHAVAFCLFQYKGGAAFAGLAVDPDDRLVLPVDVRRIDRQVGNLPIFRSGVFHVIKAFFNGVLMGTGKSREGQLPRVWLPGRDRHLRAFFTDFAYRLDVMEVQPGVHALGVHVQRHGYDIQIAGTFPVTEQTAFNPVRAGQQPQFRAGHTGTPVVMGMQADDGRFPVGQMLDKILDLVGVGIGGTHFHRSRQVDDDRVFFCSAQRFHHFMADSYGKILLRPGITFR